MAKNKYIHDDNDELKPIYSDAHDRGNAPEKGQAQRGKKRK